jgi:PPE-repeat protein
MDFGSFPPEVNSARMYAGPGSAPMLAAASAWSQLAAELRATVAGYSSVISGLTGQAWTGPASASMAAAAAPYAAWMNTAAGQAEHTANQATAAAGAYENAFAATVPPPVIATNRVQLASLVATNVLGQNTPAIMANEAHYGEMWAQDAAAMYGYAGASAAASKVTPFTAPPRTTNQSGLAAQNAAAAQTTGTSAASGVQSALSQAVSATPGTLQGLASPLQSGASASGLSGIPNPLGLSKGDITNAMSNFASGSFSPYGVAGATQIPTDIAILRGAALAASDPYALGGGVAGLGGGAAGLSGLGALQMGATAPATPVPGAATLGTAGLGGAGVVSAGIGRGTLAGALSVPQGWAAAAPAPPNPAATASLVHGWTAAPDAGPNGTPGMPGMPMTGSGGRGFGFAAPRYGFKPTVMARPLVAG